MKRILLLAAGLSFPVSSQDIDTAIFESERKPFQILDQIVDARERAAFEALFATRDAAERLRRAERFAAGHPASAFLSVAYDLAAKSCMDLGQPECVLRNAALSLRLLPENPLLLVSLAEVQAAAGKLDQAVRNARQALRYLDQFAPPSGFTPAQWRVLEPKLRASCLATLRRAGASPPTPAAAVPSSPARYAGSAACSGCHAGQHESWSRTGMGRMLQPWRPEVVFGDFEGRTFEEIPGKTAARLLRVGAKHAVEIADSNGGFRRYLVDYVIGSKWQQAYATRLDDGRLQVFPIQFNRLTGKWLNYWKGIDPPGSPRTEITRFTEMSAATNYQRNCSPCHASQVRMDARGRIEFAEPGVNCEMCHGPSEPHVAAMRAGNAPAKKPQEPPVDFKRLGQIDYMAICGQCHRQSALFRKGPRGEMNYSGRSPDFVIPTRGRPFLEFSRKAFYKDGRFRESTFIVEALERSACFQRGGAHCGHCHQPHPADFPANLTSLKYPDHPDRMCSQCHAGFEKSHTRHREESEGSRCVSCHMPRIMNSAGFRARTHTIDDIPDPAMTIRFGRDEGPNACLNCHDTRDAAWAASEIKQWPR